MTAVNSQVRSVRGAALIEATLALPLFLIIIMGLGQQFAIVMGLLEHQALATQLTLGPQERAIKFDVESATFSVLDSSGTGPTSVATFVGTLGEHIVKVAPTGTVVHLKLAYLTGSTSTGIVAGSSNPFGVSTFPAGASGPCAGDDYKNRLSAFVTSKLSQMVAYKNPATNQAVATLPKLFDITTGGNQYKEYIGFLPFIFATVCSTPLNLVYPQPAVTDFTLIPRRLVN